MRSKLTLSLILVALLLSLLVTSCGQKGELYLPADLPAEENPKPSGTSG